MPTLAIVRNRGGGDDEMTQRSLHFLAVLLAVWAAGITLVAQDWPQFLGPRRDGTYTGPPIADSWPASGPTRVWERQVGAGFAGPVVVGDRLILFHRVGRAEVVEALATETGETLWRYDYPTSYRDDFGFDEGPRSVPVVVGRPRLYLRRARAAARG